MSVFELYDKVQKEMDVLSDNDFYSIGEKSFKINHIQKILEVGSQVLIIASHELLFINPINMTVAQKMTFFSAEKCLDAIKHPTNCVSIYSSKSLRLIKKQGSRWFLVKEFVLNQISMKQFYSFFYCSKKKVIIWGNSKTVLHLDLNYNMTHIINSKKPITSVQPLKDDESYIIVYKDGLIEKRCMERGIVKTDTNTRFQIKKAVIQDDDSIQICEQWEKKYFLFDSNLQLINISVDGFTQYLSFSQQKQLSQDFWLLFQPMGASIVKRLKEKVDKFQSKKILQLMKYEDLYFTSCAIDQCQKYFYILFYNDADEAILRVYDFQCILEESIAN